jgi:hypothetical protein
LRTTGAPAPRWHFAVPAAHAQSDDRETAPALKRVEVVGSHLKRVEQEGPAPVSSSTRDEIAASGATRLGNPSTPCAPVTRLQSTWANTDRSPGEFFNGGVFAHRPGSMSQTSTLPAFLQVLELRAHHTGFRTRGC